MGAPFVLAGPNSGRVRLIFIRSHRDAAGNKNDILGSPRKPMDVKLSP